MDIASATVASKTTARENMLKSQILTGHVLHPRILAALMAVPRERFVPPGMAGSAYVDEELPLGNGRMLMEPLAFARLLDSATIEAHESVLDIGSATGYSSTVIARLARKVVALEEETAFALAAKILLADYPNVEPVRGALSEGVATHAPYDVIMIEGAIEFLPKAFGDQLREGGRLLTVEHEATTGITAGLGKLVEYRKLRGALFKTVLRDANVTLLPQFKTRAGFVF